MKWFSGVLYGASVVLTGISVYSNYSFPVLCIAFSSLLIGVMTGLAIVIEFYKEQGE